MWKGISWEKDRCRAVKWERGRGNDVDMGPGSMSQCKVEGGKMNVMERCTEPISVNRRCEMKRLMMA